MSILAQQPVISKAWDWGFDDAMAGKSEFDGYDYFAGAQLQEYFEGHRTAEVHKKTLKRLAGGSPVNQAKVKSEADLMDADLEAIRSGAMPIVQMTDELLEEIENSLF